MGNVLTSAPVFTTRVPVQFLSADAPTLSITSASPLQNNPSKFLVNTGSVGKIDPDLNGSVHYRGDGELPPFSLDLSWDQLGYNDYLRLAALRPYYITLVTYRNIGYYGKLVLSGPQSSKAFSQDVVSCKGTFFVLTPSDAGGAATVNRVAAPTALTLAGATAGTGFIPVTTLIYYWITFSSSLGETTAFAAQISPGADKCKVTLTWTWPTSTLYCTSASIYASNTNDPTTAKLVAQVPNGLTATWVDYVGPAGLTVVQTPPTANTAYRGQWAGGLWSNETP